MKVVYILGEFPSDTEYFIQNEIFGMEDRGVQICINALAAAGKTNRSSRSPRSLVYLRLFSPENVLAYLWCGLQKRPAARRALEQAGVFRSASPGEFFRSVKLFHSALFFSYRMRAAGLDQIHAHFISTPASVAVIMSELLGIPYSISAHAHDLFHGKRLKEKIDGCRFLLTCHASGKTHLVATLGLDERTAAKIRVVYHGLDVNFWRVPDRKEMGSGRGGLHILSVGRLVEKKGHVYLLEAVRTLAAGGVDVRCTIVGDGPLHASLHAYIVKEGLADRVFLAGGKPQSEVKRLFQACDLFVLPCIVAGNGDRDGIPNVVLEALAMEVPVITTPAGSTRELIVDGETGILVPERQAGAIAEAVKTLLASPELRARLRKNGRELVCRKFDSARTLDEVRQLFHAH